MTLRFPAVFLGSLLISIGCNESPPVATEAAPAAVTPTASTPAPIPEDPPTPRAPDGAAPLKTPTPSASPTPPTPPAERGQRLTPRQAKLAGALIKDGALEEEVVLDLDEDGRADLALVIKPAAIDAPRIVVLGLTDGDGFKSVHSSTCLALCPGCGGIMGDPFMGMRVRNKRGLQIQHFGGSRWAWERAYTIAWRKNGFYLVGADLSTIDRMNSQPETKISVNLLSGKYTRKGKKGIQRHTFEPISISACAAIEGLSEADFP